MLVRPLYERKKALFEGMCPNCGGIISDLRLSLGAPCEECLPIPFKKLEELRNGRQKEEFQVKVAELLQGMGKLKGYKETAEVAKKVLELDELFRKAVGNRLWSAQREWARRIFKGCSFSITAPTGLGKTVFGLVTAIYLASGGKKSYLIFPSHVVLVQALSRVKEFTERARISSIRVIGYHARMGRKKKEEFFSRLESGDFDVLLTSARFLNVNFEKLSKYKFDLIFVDDVDAILKSSKDIDKILMLLGLGDEEISLAYRLIDLKKRVAATKDEEKREAILEEIADLSKKLEDAVSRKKTGIMVIATATGRARGKRVKLFRELLKFTIGSSGAGYRNVLDVYTRRSDDVKKQVLDLVKLLGSGGLIFVGLEEGGESAGELVEYLRDNGVKAEVYHAAKSRPEAIKEFSEGKIDVLVGVASYYGMLVRGLDLPHRVRYALFTSVPKFKFRLEVSEETHPLRLYVLLSELSEYMDDDDRYIAERLIRRFRRTLLKLPSTVVEEISRGLREGEVVKEELKGYVKLCKDAITFLSNVLAKKDVLERLERSPYVSIKEVNRRRYVLVPDVGTYIQASGRTSRLFAGGVSKGISIVLVDDEKVFRGLVRQLRWRFEEAVWKRIDEIDWKPILEEVDRDRETVMRIMRKEMLVETFKDPVKSALMIVESPHKAKTISSFFGRPSQRLMSGVRVYEVTTGDLSLNIVASNGHVMDLVTNKGFHGVLVEDGTFVPVYSTIKRCSNCGEQFTDDSASCPRCGGDEITDSARIVKALREIASEVDLVLIGTDPDVEGEKIGWDLANIVKTHAKDVKRIEFHEVTRRAIRRSLKDAGELNENRVNAQIVRRIEDRWIGFVLSEKLQRAFGNKTLSAGRVQTPVLGWIIKRYREFKRSWEFVLRVKLSNGVIFELRDIRSGLLRTKKSLEEARVRVVTSKETEEELPPPPPLTTDVMLREASAYLGLSATRIMQLAQELFESGLITYHRTDSTRVSLDGINLAKEYVTRRFGEQYFKGRTWGEGEEGAHECIRPVRPVDAQELRRLIREGGVPRSATLTWDHIRLYDLIFRRFIASQMSPARVKVQKAKVDLNGVYFGYEAIFETSSPGFSMILPIKVKPRLEGGEKVEEVSLRKEPRVKPYTQGEVVRLMRERGIGRPSTYAVIIQKLLDRKYVVERRGRLYPTKLGIRVYRYLSRKFKHIVSESVTRELEEKMDQIERGVDYQKVLLEEFNEIRHLSD